MHITYGISNMKNLEASNLTKVTIYKKEKEKKKKKDKRKKRKKHDGQDRRNCKEIRKTIEFYFVLLFGNVIEKSALKYGKTYAEK